jgi:hypothetical protein
MSQKKGIRDGWPTVTFGVDPGGEGRTVASYDAFLRKHGSSLPELIATLGGPVPFTPWSRELIEKYVLAYHAKNDTWPSCWSDVVIEGDGRTWRLADGWLRENTDISGLAALIDTLRGRKLRAKNLSLEDIRLLIQEHVDRTGKKPSAHSGEVHGHPGLTWGAVNSRCQAFGTSTAAVGNELVPPVYDGLTESHVIELIESHKRRTGEWPHTGIVEPINNDGRTWAQINAWLSTRGHGKLLSVCERLGKLPRGFDLSTIKRWVETYWQQHGRWPTEGKEPIEYDGGSRTWKEASAWLRSHRHGTLLTVTQEMGNVRRGEFTEPQIRRYNDLYRKKYGKWPGNKAGVISFDGDDRLWGSLDKWLHKKGFGGLRGFQTQRMGRHDGFKRVEALPKSKRAPWNKGRVTVRAPAYIEKCLNEIRDLIFAYVEEHDGEWPSAASAPFRGHKWGTLSEWLRNAGKEGLASYCHALGKPKTQGRMGFTYEEIASELQTFVGKHGRRPRKDEKLSDGRGWNGAWIWLWRNGYPGGLGALCRKLGVAA